MTTKELQACPSLTPANTSACSQIIWFSLATICACLHLKKNQQTGIGTHEAQHMIDNYRFSFSFAPKIESKLRSGIFTGKCEFQCHLYILAFLRSQSSSLHHFELFALHSFPCKASWVFTIPSTPLHNLETKLMKPSLEGRTEEMGHKTSTPSLFCSSCVFRF